MTENDMKELEKFRAKKRKAVEYNLKYNKENYKRMVCMYPIKDSAAVDKAIKLSGEKSVSAYISMLITKDLKERGLLSD